jgi:hypothetical protein
MQCLCSVWIRDRITVYVHILQQENAYSLYSPGGSSLPLYGVWWGDKSYQDHYIKKNSYSASIGSESNMEH